MSDVQWDYNYDVKLVVDLNFSWNHTLVKKGFHHHAIIMYSCDIDFEFEFKELCQTTIPKFLIYHKPYMECAWLDY